MKVFLQKAIDDKSIAFAKITVGNPNQLKMLKNGLYNKWIEDKKLKFMVDSDLTY